MAEKYGTVPPRFTRAWWDYFWYYYKWRVIITAAAALIAAVTIVQCANRPKYDMTVTYAGNMNYSERESETLAKLLSGYITDIDGNGEPSVYFQKLVFTGAVGNEEYDYSMQTKLDLSFTDSTSRVYLMDKQEAELYLNRDSVEEAFLKTDAYAKDSGAQILSAPDGTGYAVNLADSKLLKENEIYCDDLYLLIRADDAREETSQLYEDSLSIARELIK